MELWGSALFGEPCRECGFGWSVDPAEAVAGVRAFAARARVEAASCTGEERLDGWSVAEYVAHVGDNLRQWAERVQSARLAGRTAVAGYDPDALAQARDYSAIPLQVALWSAEQAAERWAEVLTAALDEQVVLEHATRGPQRAEDVARNNAHDAHHHLHDIRRIAGQRAVRSRVLPAPTARLRFREMTHADLDDVALVLGAPDPVRLDHRPRTRADAERWIAWTRRNYAEHGFGLWVVETHDGRFVGDCGLTVQQVDGEPHVEVGYHVHPDLRGHGLATEAAAAVRDAAAADGIGHLVAIIRPANLPSRRVATKIGLSLEREAFVHGGDALVFGADLTAPA